jgi:hypothetical protein
MRQGRQELDRSADPGAHLVQVVAHAGEALGGAEHGGDDAHTRRLDGGADHRHLRSEGPQTLAVRLQAGHEAVVLAEQLHIGGAGSGCR